MLSCPLACLLKHHCIAELLVPIPFKSSGWSNNGSPYWLLPFLLLVPSHCRTQQHCRSVGETTATIRRHTVPFHTPRSVDQDWCWELCYKLYKLLLCNRVQAKIYIYIFSLHVIKYSLQSEASPKLLISGANALAVCNCTLNVHRLPLVNQFLKAIWLIFNLHLQHLHLQHNSPVASHFFILH